MSVVGLGTDIVEIERIGEGDALTRLAKRVLTEKELSVFYTHTMPARYFAKRFAAKEAAVKALGTGIGRGISWQHIEISNDQLGKPEIHFSLGALDKANELGATHAAISIADEQHYAVATVILSR
ncbi:holo-ACP synthase [Alteromonas sp. 5E99-2]|uniref:holo-ACP synthase n=1 Tax=Alteromonas sp. 5E99-2 TaxID=2817683 RepID=UPI001A98CA0B|nr:holo-ACP synthase [Alteromonas sp. 5E99-2]MBO1254315.1 holo-ACP synthase [Alteromonas sp. 5E99-2]